MKLVKDFLLSVPEKIWSLRGSNWTYVWKPVDCKTNSSPSSLGRSHHHSLMLSPVLLLLFCGSSGDTSAMQRLYWAAVSGMNSTTLIVICFAFSDIVCHHVSHPQPAAERHPWEAVDRKVSASAENYLADEAQHAEAPGAWGCQRVLDQPAVHDRGAGVRPRRGTQGPELAQDQRGQIFQFPWTQIHHRSPESPENHQDMVELMWAGKWHARTVSVMWHHGMSACAGKLSHLYGREAAL